MSSYTTYSKALEKYQSKPKWQTWLGLISIFFVWILIIKVSGENYQTHRFASTVLGIMANGAMLYIWILIGWGESTAQAVDRELGHHIEILDDELNMLKEKHEALQQEHTKLLKQTSRQ